MDFQLVSDYKPRGDQGRAIEELVSGIGADARSASAYIRRRRKGRPQGFSSRDAHPAVGEVQPEDVAPVPDLFCRAHRAPWPYALQAVGRLIASF